MIKANELRIGNLLIFKGDIKEVIGIDPHSKGIYLSNDDGVFSMELPQPIPLNPEWLKRCGFSRFNDGWVTSAMSVMLWDADKDRVYKFDFGTRSRSASIKYVHQLQNLYFALTGEELTINNETITID